MSEPNIVTSRKSKGLPGMRGVDHVGITVPDIEQATAFFVDVLGCKLLYAHGPRHDDPEGISLQARLGVSPHSFIKDIRSLRCANGANIELFEFHSSDQRTAYPRPSDHAIQHLAIYVDDLNAAIKHLRRYGVQLLSGPHPLPGPEVGVNNQFIYTHTPWGMTLELISYPSRMAYQQHGGACRWRPPAPEELRDILRGQVG